MHQQGQAQRHEGSADGVTVEVRDDGEGAGVGLERLDGLTDQGQGKQDEAQAQNDPAQIAPPRVTAIEVEPAAAQQRQRADLGYGQR